MMRCEWPMGAMIVRSEKTAKEQIRAVVEAQPDDATYDEILRELAFRRMVDRGLTDARDDRVVSNEEMGRRIRRWRK